VGMYDPRTGERLTVSGSSGGQDWITMGSVWVQ
jgi:hypothetical protein